MKTTLTALDMEAARLFRATGGMLAGWRGSRDGRRPFWERLSDGTEATPDAFDTDDPATSGAMVEQLENDGENRAVTISDRRHSLPHDPGRRFLVILEFRFGDDLTTTGPTRGAALVAIARLLAQVALRAP